MNASNNKANSYQTESGNFNRVWESYPLITFRVTLYIAIIFVAFFGNALLLLTIIFNKKMRSVTNYFLLNLALGDLMISITSMPLELVRWFYDVSTKPLVCKTMPFFQATSVGVSVYTLIVMAVDRYLAIMLPLGVHFSRKQSMSVIGGIWIAAAITASPVLVVMEVQSTTNANKTRLRCDEFGWSDPERDSSIYTIVLLLVEYFIPLVVMVYIYSRISVFLWFRKIPGAEELSINIRQKVYCKQTKRKRTIKLLLAVVSTFLICHLPQNIMSMLWYVFKGSFRPPLYMKAISFSAELLLYMNSALNPILYAFLHKKFKDNLRLVLKALCRGRKPRTTSVPRKSRTTTLISLRTRSSCQTVGKPLLSPIRRERSPLMPKKSTDSPSRETMETANL